VKIPNMRIVPFSIALVGHSLLR